MDSQIMGWRQILAITERERQAKLRILEEKKEKEKEVLKATVMGVILPVAPTKEVEKEKEKDKAEEKDAHVAPVPNTCLGDEACDTLMELLLDTR